MNKVTGEEFDFHVQGSASNVSIEELIDLDEEEDGTTTRNISMPNSHNKLVELLAERYYGGNVSHLIRASVLDHVQSLEGKDQLTLEKIQSEVSANRGMMETALELSRKILNESQGIEAQLDVGKPLKRTNIDQRRDVCAVEVRKYLSDRESAASPETITSELELSLTEVREGIHVLVHDGEVENISQDADVPKYRPVSAKFKGNHE